MIQDKDRQSIGWTYVHLFAFLTPNLLIYMWVYQSVLKYWTGASHNILQGLLTMLKSNGQPNSKGTLGKSQIVRKAFEKRRQLRETGRLSISISNKQDPIMGIGSKVIYSLLDL